MPDFKHQVIPALEKLPYDGRDISHHLLYGTTHPTSIPLIDFSISPVPPVILDQNDLDFCTGESSSSINTDLENCAPSVVSYLNSKKLPTSIHARSALAVKYGLVKSSDEYINLALAKKNGDINLKLLSCLIYDYGDYFDPLYQFAKIKQVRGEWQQTGANLRDAADALINYGSILKRESPFTYRESIPADRSRDFLANWNNWPNELDSLAYPRRLGSYATVDGPYDAFDNIRSALYLNSTQKVPLGVIFGLAWRPEWTSMPGGIINESYSESQGDGHAVHFIGQKIIEGVPYLVCPNSWGKSAGNNGIYYLPRNVINIESAGGYGAYVFKQLTAKIAKQYNANGISVFDNWFTRFLKITSNAIKNI